MNLIPVKVEFLGKEDVYDLFIDSEDHSFHVNNIPVHNSEYCRDHDNRRYYKPIDEIIKYINVHFHCRSIFVPLTDSTTKTTRASQFGPVPDESYEKWFGGQDNNFKNTALGSEKFKLYKAGLYKVGGLADVKGRTLSLETISKTLQKAAEEELKI